MRDIAYLVWRSYDVRADPFERPTRNRLDMRCGGIERLDRCSKLLSEKWHRKAPGKGEPVSPHMTAERRRVK
jgi:hypothetical protein